MEYIDNSIERNLASIKRLRVEVCRVLGEPCLIDVHQRFGFAFSPFKIPSPELIARQRPDCSTTGLTLSAAPVSEVEHSVSKIEEWKVLADKGDVFDCKENSCLAFVKVRPSKKRAITSGLALCKILHVGDQYGSLEDCQAVWWLQDWKELVNVIEWFTSVDCMMGLPDFEIIIAHKKLDHDRILATIDQALRNPSLSYTTNVDKGHIIAVAEQRVSSILKPFREMATIRIDASMFNKTADIAWTGIVLSTTLYVNRQATASEDDWHLPNRVQEQAYVSSLRSKIRELLSESCKPATWVGSSRLLCEVSGNLTPPLKYFGRPSE
jgi:hypothetical protein